MGMLQDKIVTNFEAIREMHQELCSIAKNLNRSFSLQILFIIFEDFITTILALFFSGKHILEAKHISTEYLLYSTNQVLWAVLQIISTVFTCSSTVDEVNKKIF